MARDPNPARRDLPGPRAALTRDQALTEMELRRRWASPPEIDRAMVQALREAGIWEDLAALRRYARDGRAWHEWLAGPVQDMYRRAPGAFAEGVRTAIQALRRKPDARDPFRYFEAVLSSALQGAPVQETRPGDEEAILRGGIPLQDGRIGRYIGPSVNGVDVLVSGPDGDIVKVPRAAAIERARALLALQQ